MSARPSRGAKVVYRDFDSSDESEFDTDNDDSDDLAYNSEISDALCETFYPPLTSLQLQLRQLCRLGDKDMVKIFLANNPEIDLDARDPEGEDNDFVVSKLN